MTTQGCKSEAYFIAQRNVTLHWRETWSQAGLVQCGSYDSDFRILSAFATAENHWLKNGIFSISPISNRHVPPSVSKAGCHSGRTTLLLLRLTPYAREELERARSQETGLTDLERARRFFVAAMMAINGSFGKAQGGFSFSNSYTRRGMEARVSRWTNMPDCLELIANRLSRVRIENKDAIELLDDFINRPATLVYLDPPYLADRMRGYDHDQYSEEYHERLLKKVIDAKCMVFLSGYENDLYNDYLTHAIGWHKRRIKTTTRGHNGKDSEREEIIWYNKQYSDVLKSGLIPIRLSAKEDHDKKVNPERVK